MRISDWSSDVCSSDLEAEHAGENGAGDQADGEGIGDGLDGIPSLAKGRFAEGGLAGIGHDGLLAGWKSCGTAGRSGTVRRSEEHTSELQSLMRISYAVFCLKKKKKHNTNTHNKNSTNRHQKK